MPDRAPCPPTPASGCAMVSMTGPSKRRASWRNSRRPGYHRRLTRARIQRRSGFGSASKAVSTISKSSLPCLVAASGRAAAPAFARSIPPPARTRRETRRGIVVVRQSKWATWNSPSPKPFANIAGVSTPIPTRLGNAAITPNPIVAHSAPATVSRRGPLRHASRPAIGSAGRSIRPPPAHGAAHR